ncbi:MAG TPA: hypothetical protein PLQ93_05125 [Bacteroidia bacterium]|nr:hypothetical protein [Bacteroidia bacterium]
MKKYLYIDEEQNVLRGEEARKKIAERNDHSYFEKGKGIIKVSRERWKQAQAYEKHFWMKLARNAKDDRNMDHFREFKNFACIAGRHFASAIELGCGPFTNLRLISTKVQIEYCSLEDPLLEEYLKHPHTTYSRTELTGGDLSLDPLVLRLFRRLIRPLSASMAERLVGKRKKIPLRDLLPVPIEEMPVDKTYELVVMINVIEHCQDLECIFTKILEICPKGSVFVFSDKYYDHTKVDELVKEQCFEAGHPLLADRSVIENFLKQNFDPLYDQLTHKSNEIGEFDWSYDAVYFIGVRK